MPVPACCVPSKPSLAQLAVSQEVSNARRRAFTGSIEGMVRLCGGSFLMGSESPDALPFDGEGPVREITLDPFFIARHAVTNAHFASLLS